MYPNYDDEAARATWTGAQCTLNGNPAHITGNPDNPLYFAHVVDDATGLRAEWSWAAVSHVMHNGGRFRS